MAQSPELGFHLYVLQIYAKEKSKIMLISIHCCYATIGSLG